MCRVLGLEQAHHLLLHQATADCHHGDQDRVTIRNMTGKVQPFIHVPYFCSDVFDLSYEFWGNTAGHDRVVDRGSMNQKQRSVWWVKKQALSAALLMKCPAEERAVAPRWILRRLRLDAAVLKYTRNLKSLDTTFGSQEKCYEMKKSRMGHQNKVSAAGSGRIAVETVEAPLETKATPERAAEKVNLKSPMQPVSERFPALEEQEIVLTVFAPQAREVHVAGNFNNWLPAATPMKNMGTGEWVVRLMLKSGQYEYRFVIDGLWSEDHRSSERMPNPYCSFNSVLKVPLAVRTSIL